MRTIRLLRLMCLVVPGLGLISACVRPEDRVHFGGFYFRSDAKPLSRRSSLRDFQVIVRNVSQSPEAARAAGGYEGARYCIMKFGSSEIIWTIGPETTPQELHIEKDRLVFQGRCAARR